MTAVCVHSASEWTFALNQQVKTSGKVGRDFKRAQRAGLGSVGTINHIQRATCRRSILGLVVSMIGKEESGDLLRPRRNNNHRNDSSSSMTNRNPTTMMTSNAVQRGRWKMDLELGGEA
jgi:hypothetical protein